MRRKRWIKASLLTMIAAGPVVQRLAVADTAAAAQDAASVATPLAPLLAAVNGDVPSRRQDAADQLVTRSDAVSACKAILANPDQQPGQVAIARALAKSIDPNPVFIPDLVNLLSSSPEITEAAADALAAMSYDNHPEIFPPLRSFVSNTNNPENIRVAVIGALGQIVQKPVAEFLIQLASGPNESPLLANAAMGALGDLTGINTNGNDARLWSQWWGGIRSASPADFRSRVLVTRDNRFKLFKQHNTLLLKYAKAHLEQNYVDLLNLDKEAAKQTLLSYLTDPVPEIRDIGVDVIDANALTSKGVYTAEVRTKLLDMIDDSNQGVRLHVVKVLLNINDHDAGKLLISRLGVEKDLQIRIEIVNALGKLEDPDALPALLDLLHDPHPDLVIAAADAIADLGDKLRHDDPATAASAADLLRKIVDPPSGTPGPPARDDVRAACLSALSALHDTQSLDLFLRLVEPAESSSVRQAALLGLGNLGDTRANQGVISQLDDNDKDVRAAAAVALQTTATPEQADEIFRKMKSDPYPKVADALWVALQNLYSKESPDDLNRWAADLSYDPGKRLITLQKLGDAYAAAKDAGHVAENQQAIADAMMQVNPPQRLDAIHNLQAALKYWRGPGKGDPDKQEAIVDSLLADELDAGLWTDATAFAADQIRIDPVYQTTVGPRIKNKADELSGKDADAANALIDAALKMDPPLDPRYAGQLQQIRDMMKNRIPAVPG